MTVVGKTKAFVISKYEKLTQADLEDDIEDDCFVDDEE